MWLLGAYILHKVTVNFSIDQFNQQTHDSTRNGCWGWFRWPLSDSPWECACASVCVCFPPLFTMFRSAQVRVAACKITPTSVAFASEIPHTCKIKRVNTRCCYGSTNTITSCAVIYLRHPYMTYIPQTLEGEVMFALLLRRALEKSDSVERRCQARHCWIRFSRIAQSA